MYCKICFDNSNEKVIKLQKCHHPVMKPLSLKADLTVQQAFDDESHSVEIKTYQLLMK